MPAVGPALVTTCTQAGVSFILIWCFTSCLARWAVTDRGDRLTSCTCVGLSCGKLAINSEFLRWHHLKVKVWGETPAPSLQNQPIECWSAKFVGECEKKKKNWQLCSTFQEGGKTWSEQFLDFWSKPFVCLLVVFFFCLLNSDTF